MINSLRDVVESRILQARENGEFDNLPGKGKPLEFDDDALVPEEVRAAYRVLKNAGYVPPELDQVRNRRSDGAPVMPGVSAPAERACQPQRLGAAAPYYDKVVARLIPPDSPKGAGRC